jgi:formylglycine-generating enzyme required for sulfatase activity
VTIKGNVVCNRTTIPAYWDQSSQDADHYPVMYAFEGTPEITAQLNEIMDKYYPEKGLDCDAAQKFLDEFTARLRYNVAPGELAAKMHKEAEWGSQILALTGTISEKDGKRWITVTKYEPTKVAYPPRMIEPDKPFVTSGKEPVVLKVNDALTIRCVPIPAGRFLQGSPFYQQRYQDEFPHEVVLTKQYYMSETPVTQEVFQAVMDKNPSPAKGPQSPVVLATWTDVTDFCRILSEKNGRVVRVPTDAEWEYAARVGTSNPCFTEKYKDQISEAGIKGGATPVESMKPNAWGLYDMLCGGWSLTSSYKADNVRMKEVDPQGPPKGDSSIQMGQGFPMHKSRGGYHYSFIRPNMHGAVGEDGGLWEGGTQIFRIVVEESAAK